MPYYLVSRDSVTIGRIHLTATSPSQFRWALSRWYGDIPGATLALDPDQTRRATGRLAPGKPNPGKRGQLTVKSRLALLRILDLGPVRREAYVSHQALPSDMQPATVDALVRRKLVSHIGDGWYDLTPLGRTSALAYRDWRSTMPVGVIPDPWI